MHKCHQSPEYKMTCDITADHSTVSRLDNRFHGGYVSIENDPGPGNPRTSADQRNMKLVADALEEDRRGKCEEIFSATGSSSVSIQYFD